MPIDALTGGVVNQDDDSLFAQILTTLRGTHDDPDSVRSLALRMKSASRYRNPARRKKGPRRVLRSARGCW